MCGLAVDSSLYKYVKSISVESDDGVPSESPDLTCVSVFKGLFGNMKAGATVPVWG